ncbi:MAG TPA: YqiA/YcfP family alpha/beta fold hydrolase [Burkholderiaceae bacterium]|nr:YqiA/YcfP family alpha/beta fold hydrolase [Burkholderiaceae bacterium]
MILYLHGFRSSPQSFKARITAKALQQRAFQGTWFCPQLPPGPARAMAMCDEAIEQAIAQRGLDPATGLTVIGSSLGGFYANCVAEKWQCRAVVLNPAVHPLQTLSGYVGKQTLFHTGEPFDFLPEYLDELAQLTPPRPADPQRYYLLACKGDEVLDWRDMADWYQGSRGHILEGGDHSLSAYEDWLPEILDFALYTDNGHSTS